MRNRYLTLLFCALVIALATAGCKDKDADTEALQMPQDSELTIKNDSMVYGLICDGTSDSVVVLWTFGGDPKTYSCIDAKHDNRIIGTPEIGDWAGVMVNPDDSTEATMVLDLDQLKGTWTYPVMPVMKELQNMSKRAQRRMMANMSDSVKETYLVPREYGFTLKRGHKAQAVGRIMKSNTLEDDSPVQYPEVKNYHQWYTCNGRLLLVSGEMQMPDAKQQTRPKTEVDTMDFVFMSADSLILTLNGQRYHFHRKENAIQANAAATKAAAKQAEAKNSLK